MMKPLFFYVTLSKLQECALTCRVAVPGLTLGTPKPADTLERHVLFIQSPKWHIAFIITGKNVKAEITVWHSLNKPCTTKHVCQEKHTNLRLQLSKKCSLQMSFFVIYCTQDIFINSPILLAMSVLFPLRCVTYILLWKWDHSEQIMPRNCLEKSCLELWGLKTTNTSSLLKKKQKNILFFDKYNLLQDAAATSALKKEHPFFFQGLKTNAFSWKDDPIF